MLTLSGEGPACNIRTSLRPESSLAFHSEPPNFSLTLPRPLWQQYYLPPSPLYTTLIRKLSQRSLDIARWPLSRQCQHLRTNPCPTLKKIYFFLLDWQEQLLIHLLENTHILVLRCVWVECLDFTLSSSCWTEIRKSVEEYSQGQCARSSVF